MLAQENFSSTVRLARQVAREVGCHEPIEVLCVVADDGWFNQIKFTLNLCGDYTVHRSVDFADMQQQLKESPIDFCITSVACPFSGDCARLSQIECLCDELKVPVLIFNNRNSRATEFLDASGVVHYTNGVIHEIVFGKESLDASIKRAVRLCSVDLA